MHVISTSYYVTHIRFHDRGKVRDRDEIADVCYVKREKKGGLVPLVRFLHENGYDCRLSVSILLVRKYGTSLELS